MSKHSLKRCATFTFLFVAATLVSCNRSQPKSTASIQTPTASTSFAGRVDDRLSVIRTALSRNPRHSESIIALKRLNSEYPDAPEVRKLLTSTLIGVEDWEGLLVTFRRIPESSRTSSYELELATILAKAGKYHEAFELLNDKVDESGHAINDADAEKTAWLAAFAAYQIGQLDRAATILDVNRQLFEEAGHLDLSVVRGVIHFQQGELEKAEAELRLATKALPTLPKAHQVLGQILNAQNKTDEANEELKLAAALRQTVDERKQLQINLAAAAKALDAAFLEKKFAECETHIATLMPHVKQSDKAKLFQYIATIRKSQGRLKEAREAVAKAQELMTPSTPLGQE